MFSLGKNHNGHDMVIKEVYASWGVAGLDFHCRTCDDQHGYRQDEYPKYRLALRQAQDYGNDHAGDVDSRPWSLLP